jgi:hypothetical protein
MDIDEKDYETYWNDIYFDDKNSALFLKKFD